METQFISKVEKKLDNGSQRYNLVGWTGGVCKMVHYAVDIMSIQLAPYAV